MSVSVRVQERPDRTSGVLGAAAGAALLFSVFPIPLVGQLTAAVSPVPLILQRLNRGAGSAAIATVLAAAVVGWAYSPGHAVAFLLFLVLPGLLIAQAMARGRGLVKGCAWAFGLLAAEIATLLVFAGPKMSAIALEPFSKSAAARTVELLRSGGWSPEAIEAVTEQSSLLHSAMQVVYPAFFIILGALIVLANAAVLRSYLARRDPGWLEGGEFESIRWPLGMAVAFVLGGAAVAVVPLRPPAYNVLLVLAFFFALQGLAVVSYYAHRLAGPPLLRIGLMVLVLLNPWAPQMLSLVGLFDTWFDFRKWADPPAPEAGR